MPDWQDGGTCSASYDGSEHTRTRTVLQHSQNGGAECSDTVTEDREACSQIPCYGLSLQTTLQNKCNVAEAEAHKIVSILLPMGVRHADDICLLDLHDFYSGRNHRALPDGRPSSAKSWHSMLTVTKKRFYKCICSTLCEGFDARICMTEEEKGDEELRKWLEGTCRISSGVKELAAVLRSLGVDNKDDVRFIKDQTIDQLTGTCCALTRPVRCIKGCAGIPEVRREKLRVCIEGLQNKEEL